jgi:hypothetical protein
MSADIVPLQKGSIIPGQYSLVRFPFGFKLDLGNNEMILVPYEDEVMYYCSKLRSNFLLDNCFEVKKSQTLFSVEGCNIVVMNNAIKEQVFLGEYQLKPLAF